MNKIIFKMIRVNVQLSQNYSLICKETKLTRKLTQTTINLLKSKTLMGNCSQTLLKHGLQCFTII